MLTATAEQTRELAEDHAWLLTPDALNAHINGETRIPYHHIRVMGREIAVSLFDDDVFVHAIQTQNQIGKTSTCAEGLATWLFELFPTIPIIVGAATKEMSRRIGRAVRNNIEHNSDKLSVRLAPDSKANDRFHTTKGGSLLAVGVGGGVGWPATIFIGDDLLRNYAAAQNPKIRKAAVDWILDDVLGKLRKHQAVIEVPDGDGRMVKRRVEIPPMIYLPATRYHEGDPTGALEQLFPDRFRVTHFPALADPEIVDPDPLGRAPGEAVCPAFVTAEEMEERRQVVAPATWATLYQGTPMSLTGGLVNRDKWVWAEAAPRPSDRLLTATSWDLTFSETGASWVVAQLWTLVPSNVDTTLWDVYLLDQMRRKAGFIDQRKLVRHWLKKRARDASHHLIENKANGPAIISDLSRPWIDLDVEVQKGERRRQTKAGVGLEGGRRWPAITGIIPIEVNTSKLARVVDVSPLVHNGQVHLPTWWEPKEPLYDGDPGDRYHRR